MTRSVRVALVPGVLALLPQYAGQVDPVADLRAAAEAATSWVAQEGPVTLVADAQGARVGRQLLTRVGAEEGDDSAYLVVANGSARRSATAPGYVDERAVPFDSALEVALRTPDLGALTGLDIDLGAVLLVGNVPGLVRLGALLRGAGPAMVDYADDPYGVLYWVMRWTVTDLGRRPTHQESPT